MPGLDPDREQVDDNLFSSGTTTSIAVQQNELSNPFLNTDLKQMMSRSRRPLIALVRDFIVGVIILGVLLLIWQIVLEAGRHFVALSPVDPDWFADSWLNVALGTVLLMTLIIILGRGCQALFGRRLATTPGFRRLVRSGELLVTELNPTETRGYKVVLVKLTPEDNRRLALLSSVLEDPETGRKLAAVFVPGTPNVRIGETLVIPFDQLTMTNWSVRDAVTFLMSGGTVSPPSINFDVSAPE